MPTTLLTSLSPILEAIQSQLMTTTSFPIERVRLVKAWPRSGEEVGDQDLNVRPLGFIVHEEDGVEGAGRLETIIHRDVGVMIRSRLGVDYLESAQAWLTDPTLGYLPIEEQVIDSLHGFIPVDGSNNILVTQQIKLRSGEAIEAVYSDNPEFGGCVLHFEVCYLPPLTLGNPITNY